MFKKLSSFLRKYFLEEVLFLLMVGFFLVQSLSLVYMMVIVAVYFLIISGFNDNLISRGIKSGIRDVKKERWYWVLILILVALLFIWQFSFKIIFLLTVFLALIPNNTFLSKWIKKGVVDVKKERLYGALLVVILVLLIIWQFSLESVVFLTLFIAFVFYRWDSRIIATGALVSLASCPILLIAKQDALAEQMAVYAYYFLVMTVVLQIIEYKRHPEEFKEEQNGTE